MNIFGLKLEKFRVGLLRQHTSPLHIKINRMLRGSSGDIKTPGSFRACDVFGQFEQPVAQPLIAPGAADMKEFELQQVPALADEFGIEDRNCDQPAVIEKPIKPAAAV